MAVHPATARLVGALLDLPTSRALREQLRPGVHRKAGGLWGASGPALLAGLCRSFGARVLVLTADDLDSLQLQADLQSFGQDSLVLVRSEADDDGRPSGQSESDRARALDRLHQEPAPLIASIEALLAPAPTPQSLRQGRLLLRAGHPLDRTDVLARAAKAGLRAVPLVLAPGEVSARGDVVDLYPLTAERGVRLEFLDQTLESIRTFDPATQRAIAVHAECALALGTPGQSASGPVLRHLSMGGLLTVHYEPLRIEQRTALLAQFGTGFAQGLQAVHDTLRPAARLDLSSLPSQDFDYKVLSAGSAAGSGEADPAGRLRSVRGVAGAVLLFCRTEDERGRLAEIFARKGLDLEREQVSLLLGSVSRGFRVPELRTTVLSNVEFAGVQQSPRVRERPVVPSRVIQGFFELGPGDLVVHAVHGIARFEGTELVQRGAGAEDHLRLRFADDVLLLVPATKIHLVQKYVGAGSAAVLDKLGGKGFQRRKEQVQEALFDLAADLLEVQASRQRTRRPARRSEPMERDFLDAFPFRDTPDQVSAWREIAADLEQDCPMDRLLCGDVGFGKTELALRAAFRVAVAGAQVAVLAPTTLLVEQHWRTFSRRCEPFGLRVEWLSRYRPPRQRRALLDDLRAGKVDVLVGTHQILGPQVAFADLGLLVIDEEQRFGVRQKEQLKRLRSEVDVLTLSATPIPRTLHSALLGIRSISTLASPPPGRQEIETRVAFRDDRLLQEALQRELGRGGQAFVLHNRIAELEPLARRIRALVPQARLAIGHGQMTDREVERTVRAFVRGEIDVLVCTTIVENGLDLPRANTILIDRADQFGLAELHQLRGRVGRSDVPAFCLLLLDRDAPPGADGRQRLKALEELSHLGAGFAIAMKDLEIRGAGNLLGPQQSGHIAAVGYDMYCRLLAQAVAEAQGARPAPVALAEVDVDLRLDAHLPADFVAEPRARLELLREMDAVTDDAALAAAEQDLADRFGRLPKPVRNLLAVFRLKHGLQELGVLGVQWVEDDRLVVRHPAGEPLGGAWLDAFADVRPVEAGKTHLILPRLQKGQRRSGEQVLEWLLQALSGRTRGPIIPERCDSGRPPR
jgi:transcription-repair coupling factor (superfamily II helicase)